MMMLQAHASITLWRKSVITANSTIMFIDNASRGAAVSDKYRCGFSNYFDSYMPTESSSSKSSTRINC